jgi:hypothetical protein
MPVSATVELPNDTKVITPAEVTLRYVPFGNQTIRVSANGYRTIEANLRKDEIRSVRYLGTAVRGARRYGDKGSRGEVRYLLVPEHGPSGTWSEEDVP